MTFDLSSIVGEVADLGSPRDAAARAGGGVVPQQSIVALFSHADHFLALQNWRPNGAVAGPGGRLLSSAARSGEATLELLNSAFGGWGGGWELQDIDLCLGKKPEDSGQKGDVPLSRRGAIVGGAA